MIHTQVMIDNSYGDVVFGGYRYLTHSVRKSKKIFREEEIYLDMIRAKLFGETE